MKAGAPVWLLHLRRGLVGFRGHCPHQVEHAATCLGIADPRVCADKTADVLSFAATGGNECLPRRIAGRLRRPLVSESS